MTYSAYTTAFQIIKHRFDYKAALSNWMTFANEISIAVNISDDGTLAALEAFAADTRFPISIIQTDFKYDDPFMYGKIENAAMQNCTGDVLIQMNLDEFLRIGSDALDALANQLYANPQIGAYFAPVINLYGSKDHYLDLGYKWRIHKPGYFRGAVNFGLKDDGRPDYNKTSTDELIDRNGNLVPTANLLPDLTIENLRAYALHGMPVAFHAGFLNLSDRLDRSIWWKGFWEKATAGDANKHATSMEELAARETKVHGLQLWDSTS